MILATRSGRDAEFRAADLSAVAPRPGVGSFTAGVPVTTRTSIGVPAIAAAVRIAAQSVAVLELGVWRGPRRSPERVTAGWRSRLFAGQPNDQQSMFTFLETIEESLSFRGNAYVWKVVDPATGQVVEWFALHPDQVMPTYDGRRAGLTYQVAVAPATVDPVGKGFGFYSVGAETVLHVKGHGDGGWLVAPSPVERFRSAIGAAVAKIAHEANLYKRGTSVRLAITYPETIRREQAEQWRDSWKATYEGTDGASTAVLGGGGTIHQIGLSQADAQFIESQNFSVSDVARMFAVPASLLDGGASGRGADSTPLTPEHEEDRWMRYGLGPRLARIECALAADRDLFGAGGTYPMFDRYGILRGDLMTEETIAHQRVQDGRLLVDEWRADHGLPPLPDGAGMVPQVTPVGGGPNPQPATTPAPAVEPDSRGRGGEREHRMEARVDIPQINVHVPEQPAPIVNVTVPPIDVPPAVVHVAVEPTPVYVDVAAPVVQVEAPTVQVDAPIVQVDAPVIVENPTRKVTLERDAAGRLKGAKVEDG